MNTSELELFDLKRAEAGDVVVTLDGRPFRFAGFLDSADCGVVGWVSANGVWQGASYNMSELRMAPKKRKVWVYYSIKHGVWFEANYKSTADELSKPGYPIFEGEVPA